MKVTIKIDCTPLKARQFFGLPDVQPMQAALLAQMEKRLMAEAEKFTPEGLMQAGSRAGRRVRSGSAAWSAAFFRSPGRLMRSDPAKRADLANKE